MKSNLRKAECATRAEIAGFRTMRMATEAPIADLIRKI